MKQFNKGCIMFNKKNKAFTLIELILVLSISSAITFMSFNKFLKDQEMHQANNAGEQLKQIGSAVNSYISIKYDKLATMSNAIGNGKRLKFTIS